jgi:hypothetical protein
LRQGKLIILRNSSGNQKVPSNPLQSDKEREVRKNNKGEDEKKRTSERHIMFKGEKGILLGFQTSPALLFDKSRTKVKMLEYLEAMTLDKKNVEF